MKSNALKLAPLGALAALCCAAHAESFRRTLQDHEVVMDKELLITATEVVDSNLASYPGSWSFGHLMDEAFGVDKAQIVVRDWLQTWLEGHKPKSDRARPVPARSGVQGLIETWQKLDGYREGDGEWIPNFTNAPFRLLSIVNRMDLSVPADSLADGNVTGGTATPAYYSGSPGLDSLAGEGRFVFGALDADGKPLEATFILEYGLDAGRTKERLLDWARAWHALGEFEDHGVEYREHLAKLTRAFTNRRTRTLARAAGGVRAAQVFDPRTRTFVERRPDPNLKRVPDLDLGKLSVLERLSISPSEQLTQLIRIRSAERAFGNDLEFRQWDTRRGEPGLDPAALPGTPRDEFYRKGSRENRFLARWLRKQRGSLTPISTTREIANTGIPSSFVLPQVFKFGGETQPVSAMVSRVPKGGENHHWDGRGVNDDELRRSFSTQTCAGCHCGDTNTRFFHILPRGHGEASNLSTYLRVDLKPVRLKDPATKRQYKSSEMAHRAKIFASILKPDVGAMDLRRIRSSRVH